MVSRFAQRTYVTEHWPLGPCASCGAAVSSSEDHARTYSAQEHSFEVVCGSCYLQICRWAAAHIRDASVGPFFGG